MRIDVELPTYDDDAAVLVVAAAEGYPTDVRTGDVIEGLDAAAAESRASRCSAPASPWARMARLVTAGGRVLEVVGRGPDLPTARARAYDAVGHLRWPGVRSTEPTSPARCSHDGYKVAILMGSPNDRDKMQPAADMLERFGIEADVRVHSAHRTPAKVARAGLHRPRERLQRLHLRRRHGRPPRRCRRRPHDAPGRGRAASRAARSTAWTRSTPPCRCPRASRWRPSPSTAPRTPRCSSCRCSRSTDADLAAAARRPPRRDRRLSGRRSVSRPAWADGPPTRGWTSRSG